MGPLFFQSLFQGKVEVGLMAVGLQIHELIHTNTNTNTNTNTKTNTNTNTKT